MVRWIVWVAGVVADGTGAQVGCFFRVDSEILDAVWIGGDEEVTPAIEVENIPALMSKFFQDVDTAIHQANHGIPWSGPPIAVALSGLITG